MLTRSDKLLTTIPDHGIFRDPAVDNTTRFVQSGYDEAQRSM